MGNARTSALLLALVVAVPVIVVLALGAAVLLARAGFGLVVWALAPFVVSMALILVLGIVLGRAAARSAGESPEESRRSGGDDGV